MILSEPLKDPEQRATDPQRLTEIASAFPGAKDCALIAIDMDASNVSQTNQASQDDYRDRTFRALEGIGNVDDKVPESRTCSAERARNISHSSQEDLFLNLARDDTMSKDIRDPLSRVERRLVSTTFSDTDQASSDLNK